MKISFINTESRRFTAPFVFLLILAILLSTASTVWVNAETSPIKEAENMLKGIEAFASEKQNATVGDWINGTLTAAPELNEWYALGIAKRETNADLTPYAEALEAYLKNNTVYSATTRQKYGLTLIACGKSDSEHLAGLVDETAGKQGIMSYVFALHLLTNGSPSENLTPEKLIPILLKLSCEDGGWSLTGKTPDVDVTAMTVQALAPYYNAYGEVKTTVDAAILRLSAMQQPDGSFKAYGEANPESAAQVIVALTSLGIDPLTDSRFIKDGNTVLDAIREHALPDGSFNHRKGDSFNHAATSQVFLGLTALLLQAENGLAAPFFLFTDPPTTFPSLDTSLSDGLPDKGGSQGNGNNGEKTEENGKDTVNPEENTHGAYKLPVCLGISAVAVIVCAVMLFRKRKALSDYLIVVIAAALLCLGVNFIDVYTPEEYYGQTVTKTDPIGTVTVEIRCDTELTDRDNAVILGKTSVEIEAGETVYDLLVQVCQANRIVLDAMSGSPTGGVYIRGIDGLHEFAYGDLSGWTYTVNGEQLGIGSDKYVPSPDDEIVWIYSDTLGN